MNITLEERVGTVLSSSDTASDVVAILIADVETAIVAADKEAEVEREKALDPLASPDAAKARASMEDAAFTRERLRTVLPRLQQRLQDVQAQEYAAGWLADYEQVKIKCDALAQEYGATYPKFVAQVVDLFSRAEAADREVSRVNGSAPAGEHRRLRQTELVARGLDNFSRADPPIAKAVQLPDWTNSEKMVWPPPQPSLAAVFAMSMPSHDPRYTADWAAALEKDNARRAATEARWAEEEAARQEESRRVYETSLRR